MSSSATTETTPSTSNASTELRCSASRNLSASVDPSRDSVRIKLTVSTDFTECSDTMNRKHDWKDEEV